MGYAMPHEWKQRILGTESRPRQRILVLFVALLGLQTLGLVWFGTGREGTFVSAAVQTVASVAAAVCGWSACHRARGYARVFWCFVSLSITCWVLANVAFAWSGFAGIIFAPRSLFATLYRFYALPIVMLLLVRDNLESRLNLADLFDFLQIAILSVLLYLGLFYLPASNMNPRDAQFLNLVGFTNAQNLLLIGFATARYRLTKSSSSSDLLIRLLLFLLSYGLVASVGNVLVLFANASIATAFDVVWSAFYLFAALLAATWIPSAALPNTDTLAFRSRFVAHNTALAVVVTSIILLANTVGGPWHRIGDGIVIISIIVYAIRLSLTESRQQQVSKALRQSEQQYRYLFGKSPQPMWIFDSEDLRFLDVNEATVQSYGYSREEFLAMTMLDIRPSEEVPAFLRKIKADLASEIRPQGVWKHKKKDGQAMEVEVNALRIVFDGHDAVLSLIHDVTARRSLEEQLRQAQKMEAVGLLAGGIAHDFNNLLNVILGYLQLIPDNPGDTNTLNRYTSKAVDATRRAATLVRQLLAFSRKQVLWPRVLYLNTVISELGKMLPRVLGERIETVVTVAADLGAIKVDEGQIEQVVLNIAVNARDAMPNGGTLAIATRNRVVCAEDPSVQMMPPGRYVELSIGDTGTGMDEAVLSRIFEPFFSTKEKGKGTGLGLAIVYGIVTQSGGFVQVSSAPGKGTTFHIFFPQVDESPQSVAHDGAKPKALPTKIEGTILLVEDEDALRSATLEYLKRTGCRLLAAHDGCEALALLEHDSNRVDLLITDVIMPKMGGDELARQARRLYPKIKIIFVSGYNDEMAARAGVLDASCAFLPKPYTFRDLARKIHEVLSVAPQREAAKACGD
jgi:hypothetical protein